MPLNGPTAGEDDVGKLCNAGRDTQLDSKQNCAFPCVGEGGPAQE